MITRLNSYILPGPLVDKMISTIKETEKEKVELGFGLCKIRNTNIITSGKDCTGTECSLVRTQPCLTGSYSGGYHTHPKGDVDPSIADMETAYINEIECIGSVRDKNIKCLLRIGRRIPEDENKIIIARKEFEEPLKEKIILEERIEGYQKWKNVRDDILARHFKQIEVK